MHLDVVLSNDVSSVVLDEITADTNTSSAWHDAWFLDTQYLSDVHNAIGLVSLSALAAEHTEGEKALGIQWSDVLPAITRNILQYNGQLVGFPVSGDMLMMYYRKDLLAAVGEEAVPATWDEVRPCAVPD